MPKLSVARQARVASLPLRSTVTGPDGKKRATRPTVEPLTPMTVFVATVADWRVHNRFCVHCHGEFLVGDRFVMNHTAETVLHGFCVTALTETVETLPLAPESEFDRRRAALVNGASLFDE